MEKALLQWCRGFCDAARSFIDVGAGLGEVSIPLAPYFQVVHAFDADWKTYLKLCGSVATKETWNIVPHFVKLDRDFQALDVWGIQHVGFLRFNVPLDTLETILRGAHSTLQQSQYPPFIIESWHFVTDNESLSSYIQKELGYRLVPLVGFPYITLATFATTTTTISPLLHP